MPDCNLSTILQRTQPANQAQSTDTVVITTSEYKKLQESAREYEVLVKCLLAAGTPIESIRILVQSSDTLAPSVDDSSCMDTSDSTESCDTNSIASTWLNKDNVNLVNTLVDRPFPFTPMTSDNELPYSYEPMEEEQHNHTTHFIQSDENRSLVLEGLPKSTTPRDIAKIVRGGAILNFFIRPQQGMAHIAFLDPRAAKRYLIHARKQRLNMKGKELTVRWDERQYHLTDGLARQVQYGATRNLVVRFPQSDITENVIREDLEHIDRLTVVDINFRNGHAWISLNSIKHAITARSCMSSRLRYRGCRVEFRQDECAEALVTRGNMQQGPQSRNANTMFNNRFLALRNSESSGSESD